MDGVRRDRVTTACRYCPQRCLPFVDNDSSRILARINSQSCGGHDDYGPQPERIIPVLLEFAGDCAGQHEGYVGEPVW
jgi:hypothetical protein